MLRRETSAVAVPIGLGGAKAFFVPAMTIRRALIGKIGFTIRGAELLSRFGLAGAVGMTAFHRVALLDPIFTLLRERLQAPLA